MSVFSVSSYKGEEGGQEEEQNSLFCVVLCSNVLLGGRAQQKEEKPNDLSFLPSTAPPLPPCSLTYLSDPVEWAEMAWGVKRPTHADGPQCRNVCPTEKEKAREEESVSQGHLSVTLALSPFLFPFLLIGRGSPFSLNW